MIGRVGVGVGDGMVWICLDVEKGVRVCDGRILAGDFEMENF